MWVGEPLAEGRYLCRNILFVRDDGSVAPAALHYLDLMPGGRVAVYPFDRELANASFVDEMVILSYDPVVAASSECVNYDTSYRLQELRADVMADDMKMLVERMQAAGLVATISDASMAIVLRHR